MESKDWRCNEWEEGLERPVELIRSEEEKTERKQRSLFWKYRKEELERKNIAIKY